MRNAPRHEVGAEATPGSERRTAGQDQVRLVAARRAARPQPQGPGSQPLYPFPKATYAHLTHPWPERYPGSKWPLPAGPGTQSIQTQERLGRRAHCLHLRQVEVAGEYGFVGRRRQRQTMSARLPRHIDARGGRSAESLRTTRPRPTHSNRPIDQLDRHREVPSIDPKPRRDLVLKVPLWASP